MNRRFAVPIDERTVVIRAEPVTTLEVLRTESPSEAQLVISQPSMLPTLDEHEMRMLQSYFRWGRKSSYWWRTLYPALLNLETISPGVEIGRLVEVGEVVPVAGAASRRPQGLAFVFATTRSPEASHQTLEGPRGPQLEHGPSGKPIHEYHSAFLQAYLARFPEFGSDLQWLWLLRGKGLLRPSHRRAFEEQFHVLQRVEEVRPGSAIAVQHHGTLRTDEYRGPYAATGRPVGTNLEGLLNGAGTLWAIEPLAFLQEIARDLLETIGALHSLNPPLALGPLSLSSLRFYPSYADSPSKLRTRIVAAPGAGAIEEKVPKLILEMFPDGTAAYLRQQFDSPYIRTPAQDLRGIGYCLSRGLSSLGRVGAPLYEFSTALAEGVYDRPDAALVDVVNLPHRT